MQVRLFLESERNKIGELLAKIDAFRFEKEFCRA